jgi:hypothetical protein
VLRLVNPSSLLMYGEAVHTLIPPPFTHAKVYTILVGGDFPLPVQCLRNSVLCSPTTLLDQVSCCAICDIGLCHEWSFLTELLGNAQCDWRELGGRLLDCFRSDVCFEAV